MRESTDPTTTTRNTARTTRITLRTIRTIHVRTPWWGGLLIGMVLMVLEVLLMVLVGWVDSRVPTYHHFGEVNHRKRLTLETAHGYLNFGGGDTNKRPWQ